MGALTGQYILDGAWIKANEQIGGAAIRWPAAEGLRWLNNAAREIVNQLPSSNSKRGSPVVAAGTRQDFANLAITDGLQVTDVVCNLLADGTTRGRPIRKAERAWLDDNIEDWHSQTGTAITTWVQDPRDPKAFYIFPRPTAGSKIELVYSAAPVDLTNPATAWQLDDVYANAAEAFVLYSFYSKDATYTKNPQIANGYWTLFLQMLGVRGSNLAGFAGVGDRKATGSGQGSGAGQ